MLRIVAVFTFLTFFFCLLPLVFRSLIENKMFMQVAKFTALLTVGMLFATIGILVIDSL